MWHSGFDDFTSLDSSGQPLCNLFALIEEKQVGEDLRPACQMFPVCLTVHLYKFNLMTVHYACQRFKLKATASMEDHSVE